MTLGNTLAHIYKKCVISHVITFIVWKVVTIACYLFQLGISCVQDVFCNFEVFSQICKCETKRNVMGTSVQDFGPILEASPHFIVMVRVGHVDLSQNGPIILFVFICFQLFYLVLVIQFHIGYSEISSLLWAYIR